MAHRVTDIILLLDFLEQCTNTNQALMHYWRLSQIVSVESCTIGISVIYCVRNLHPQSKYLKRKQIKILAAKRAVWMCSCLADLAAQNRSSLAKHIFCVARSEQETNATHQMYHSGDKYRPVYSVKRYLSPARSRMQLST